MTIRENLLLVTGQLKRVKTSRCFHNAGTAIFFEFKHYKPKKDIVSTRCFAFMEQDEFKPGPPCIEL